MKHSDMQAMESRLGKIRTRFLGVLQARQTALLKAAINLDNQAQLHESLLVFQEIAHKIRGTAPTLGFEKLGQVAAMLEDETERVIGPSLSIAMLSQSNLIPVLEDALREIESVLAAAPADAPPCPNVSSNQRENQRSLR